MAIDHDAPDNIIAGLRQRLLDLHTPLPVKYRALFALRNLRGPQAQDAIVAALQDSSALFRHEVAYCLGQRQDPAAIPTLRAVLEDPTEHAMVRHEAGEALGAIGGPECLQLLEAHEDDPCLEVAQTCQLALQRIQHFSAAALHAQPSTARKAPCTAPACRQEAAGTDGAGQGPAQRQPSKTTQQQISSGSMQHAMTPCCPASAAARCCAGKSSSAACDASLPQQESLHQPAPRSAAAAAADGDASPYLSVDPAPAAPLCTPTPALRAALLDEAAPIFERYRALFALRNKGGRAEVDALDASLAGGSALLKHEVAYVLGQMQDAAAIGALERVLRDTGESAMVRHEAAEALGSIADARCKTLLQEYCSDAEPIVAQSCIVALDILAHEASGEFQYADVGVGGVTA